MTKFTKEQAIIVSAYTGFLACKFSDMHEAVELKLGRPVWTHEFADDDVVQEIQDAFADDFKSLCDTENW